MIKVAVVLGSEMVMTTSATVNVSLDVLLFATASDFFSDEMVDFHDDGFDEFWAKKDASEDEIENTDQRHEVEVE